jgi:hypothetical protein
MKKVKIINNRIIKIETDEAAKTIILSVRIPGQEAVTTTINGFNERAVIVEWPERGFAVFCSSSRGFTGHCVMATETGISQKKFVGSVAMQTYEASVDVAINTDLVVYAFGQEETPAPAPKTISKFGVRPFEG